MSQTATESTALLRVEALSAAMGDREVLSDVSFAIEKGQVLGLVGETGSGKTMTCRAIMGLLDRAGGQITGGRIAFRGTTLTGRKAGAWTALRGREVALVPQSSLTGLDPVMTIGRQVEETVRLLDKAASPAQRCHELLEMVEMPTIDRVLKSYAHQLSGGMRQRAMIALAMAGRPSLLVADEPTTALDVTVQRAILEILRGLCDTEGLGVIIVTHDLGVVAAIGDLVAVMYAGMTVEVGAVSEVLARPQHPYTVALLNARPGVRRSSERLMSIAGSPPAPEDWLAGCRFAPRCSQATEECGAWAPHLLDMDGGHAAACIRQEELRDG